MKPNTGPVRESSSVDACGGLSFRGERAGVAVIIVGFVAAVLVLLWDMTGRRG
jgi:hypothetical protein